jgi:hypothetical protein
MSRTSQGSRGTGLPVPVYNTGSYQSGLQPLKSSLAMTQQTDQSDSRPEPRDAKRAIPRRVTSYAIYESSSSDWYAVPKPGPRKAVALASSNADSKANPSPDLQETGPKYLALTRRDSPKLRRSPTSRITDFSGRDKESSLETASQRQQAPVPTTKPLDGGAVKTGLESALGEVAKRPGRDAAGKSPQAQQQQPAKIQAKAARGGGIVNPLWGRWGWGWGK